MEFSVGVRFPTHITARCKRCGSEWEVETGASGLVDATDADGVFDVPGEIEIDGCPGCQGGGGPDGGETVAAE